MGIGKHFGLSSETANRPKIEQQFTEILWRRCQCSCSSEIPSQDDPSNYHQFLSLYKIRQNKSRTELAIFNTVTEREEVKFLDSELNLDVTACITQLPNGELFCYGNYKSGITFIIDRNCKVRMLPSGTPSLCMSALYYNNNIYFFGTYDDKGKIVALCRKFDLKKNRYINLTSFPEADFFCSSVIFNGNILISGYKIKNFWLFSPEIRSFSVIPNDFASKKWRLLINLDNLYLIEWGSIVLIYESKDGYHWENISKLEGKLTGGFQMYCLYHKEKVYISAGDYYYQFDLKEKVVCELKV